MPSPSASAVRALAQHVSASAVRPDDYRDTGTESLDNQARVVVGKYSQVDLEHGQAPPDLPQ